MRISPSRRNALPDPPPGGKDNDAAPVQMPAFPNPGDGGPSAGPQSVPDASSGSQTTDLRPSPSAPPGAVQQSSRPRLQRPKTRATSIPRGERAKRGGLPPIPGSEPPAAYRPFLDALAELLAAEVFSRITGCPGPRAPRNVQADSEGPDAPQVMPQGPSRRSGVQRSRIPPPPSPPGGSPDAVVLAVPDASCPVFPISLGATPESRPDRARDPEPDPAQAEGCGPRLAE